MATELAEIGVGRVVEQKGGVGFEGNLEDAYRVCLWSRIAARVLMPLTSFEASNARQLYEGVRSVAWHEHLDANRTLAVDVAGRDAPAGPSHFVALKTKDAIVDQIRDRSGRRPSVDTARPDIRINVHLRASTVSVSLDFAGRGLHRRGIHRIGAAAPLKESLAAAVLRLAGWMDQWHKVPLYDPFCGSGTILVEAAWMALDIAPGLFRKRIGAEGWRGHDAAVWHKLRTEAKERLEAARSRQFRIAGSDASASTLDDARANLENAGLGDRVALEHRELRKAEPPFDEVGLVVTNPPYGERLGEVNELAPLYQLLGDTLKRRFPGWVAWVLCGERALAKRIGLRPKSRTPLFNGPIECRLLEIPIGSAPVEGSRGPGWRKPGPEAEAFSKKLSKNSREAAKWAKKEGLTCYRVYDSDMRQFNLSIDWYHGAVRVEEYERPKKIGAEGAERRLLEALEVIPDALGVRRSEVSLRVRSRREGHEQHRKRDARGRERPVEEGDLRFLVNLHDYLDTGLFLDDRLVRKAILDRSEGIHFLNLFSYTCTASVAAAKGGALTTTNVDLSQTYLAWGRRNFELNGFDSQSDAHRFLRTDVLRWVGTGMSRSWRYQLMLVAPPTFSRSKAMDGDFDVQRDHVNLLRGCARLLTDRGVMIFTSNLRTFELDEAALRGWQITDITVEMTPQDFARRPRLRAWALSPRSTRSAQLR